MARGPNPSQKLLGGRKVSGMPGGEKINVGRRESVTGTGDQHVQRPTGERGLAYWRNSKQFRAAGGWREGKGRKPGLKPH